jgi:hypothetical protein
MKVRWLLRLGVMFLAFAGSVWFSLQFWPFSGCPSRVNCNRITPGMSREDVYGLLGGPGWEPDCGVGIPPGEHPEFWEWLDYSIRIDFDNDGPVIREQHGSN